MYVFIITQFMEDLVARTSAMTSEPVQHYTHFPRNKVQQTLSRQSFSSSAYIWVGMPRLVL